MLILQGVLRLTLIEDHEYVTKTMNLGKIQNNER